MRVEVSGIICSTRQFLPLGIELGSILQLDDMVTWTSYHSDLCSYVRLFECSLLLAFVLMTATESTGYGSHSHLVAPLNSEEEEQPLRVTYNQNQIEGMMASPPSTHGACFYMPKELQEDTCLIENRNEQHVFSA